MTNMIKDEIYRTVICYYTELEEPQPVATYTFDGPFYQFYARPGHWAADHRFAHLNASTPKDLGDASGCEFTLRK